LWDAMCHISRVDEVTCKIHHMSVIDTAMIDNDHHLVCCGERYRAKGFACRRIDDFPDIRS
jgi:hypothetical protein